MAKFRQELDEASGHGMDFWEGKWDFKWVEDHDGCLACGMYRFSDDESSDGNDNDISEYAKRSVESLFFDAVMQTRMKHMTRL